MATDRFVYWQKEQPSHEEFQHYLEDFVGLLPGENGQVLGTVEWKPDQRRWYILLAGKSSHPLQRISEAPIPAGIHRDERFIEIYWDKNYVDIIIRSADVLTRSIANGLQNHIANYWHAKKEET